MKPHLPNRLFRALLASLSTAVCFSGHADAAVMRDDVAAQYYLDFAFNKGMFRMGAQNIQVYRTDGSKDGCAIPLMPNMNFYSTYSGSNGKGGGGLTNAQYFSTAAHCGVPASFSKVGFVAVSDNDVGYRYETTGGSFSYSHDGMTIRLNKLVTDVCYAPLCTDAALLNGLASNQNLIYRVGDGRPGVAIPGSSSFVDKDPGGPFGGTITAGYVAANSHSTSGNWSITAYMDSAAKNPLEVGPITGDSGSGACIYNEKTGQFEFIGVLSVGQYPWSGYGAFARYEYNPSAIQAGEDALTQKYALSDANTEKILWGTRDTATGLSNITQGETEMAAQQGLGSNAEAAFAKTKAAEFSSSGSALQTIEFQGDVNTGAGSINFTQGNFKLTAKEGLSSVTLDFAGFLIDSGATVTTDFTGTANSEWRKVGAGILNIEGSGNQDINLIVGGGVMKFDKNGEIIHEGEVRLNRTGGYAAKNISLSAGVASVVLMADGQINGTNFSFGNMGGVLNMNGHNLSWDRIQHTDYGATIANYKLSDSTAETQADSTFTFTGSGTYKGAFRDGGSAEKGLLKVAYAGESGKTFTLTGVSDNQGGFEVQSGTLLLQGSLTEHVRFTDANDWTYAGITTNRVTVKDGAQFSLGHHAVLNGDVEVEDGGKFLMMQGVNATSESVLGGQRQQFSNVANMKGNVHLAGSRSSMQVATSSPVALSYAGAISGEGSFDKTGTGKLCLDGSNSFSGAKSVTQGDLIAKSVSSLGDTSSNKWLIAEGASLAVTETDSATVLAHIDGSSQGALGLTQDQSTQLDLSGHKSLFIGAAGQDLHYGTANSELTAYDGAWRLGGAGGTLYVDFKLTGANDLLIGSEHSSGTVVLTNTANSFSGNIVIGGTGNVLSYSDAAVLGGAKIKIDYGNQGNVFDGNSELLGIVNKESKGVLGLHSKTGEAITTDINLQSLGADFVLGGMETETYSGHLTAYSETSGFKFGGQGTLILDTKLTGSQKLQIDGQGFSSGRIVFAQDNAFAGDITVGGKMSDSNSSGSVGISATSKDALAGISSLNLQKGGVLYLGETDIKVNNLQFNGGKIVNEGGAERKVYLNYDSGKNVSFANSSLGGSSSQPLNIVKTGAGTLNLGKNNAYCGTFRVEEGLVKASVTEDMGPAQIWGTAVKESSFSTNSSNRIELGEKGTLELSMLATNGKYLGEARLDQTVTGTGTLKVHSGASMFLLNQTAAFNGTVDLYGSSRLYIGDNLKTALATNNNLTALQGATIKVAAGSQARVTNQVLGVSTTLSVCNSNFIINGSGYNGATNYEGWSNYHNTYYAGEYLNAGALSVDCGSVINGTVTLESNATIASNSDIDNAYGKLGYLGGTINGAILGEGKDLSLAGNESMSFKADAQSNYRNLSIETNGNGHRGGGTALTLSYGAKQSTVSTALGTGSVSMKAGHVLAFENSNSKDNSIVYSYANNFNVGDGAKLESRYNVSELRGSVSLTGSSLNLSATNESILCLRGGLEGDSSKSVAIADASHIQLGGGTAHYAGSLNLGTNVTLDLLDAAAVNGASLVYNSGNSLSLSGTGNYSFSSMSGAENTGALKLSFDFSSGTAGSQITSSSLANFSGQIFLQLNETNDLQQGEYKLLSNGSALDSAAFTLGMNLDNRLSLKTEGSDLFLVVGEDARLYWSGKGSSNVWDESSSNWTNNGDNSQTNFSSSKSIVLDATGASENGSESIQLNSDISSGSMLVKDKVNYSLTGEGHISGSSLTVAKEASLKIETAGNSFSEGVTIHNGSLELAKANALSSSAIELQEDSTLVLSNKDALGSGSTLNFAGGTLELNSDGADLGGKMASGSQNVRMDSKGHNASISSLTNVGSLELHNTAEGSSSTISIGGGSLTNVSIDKGVTLKQTASAASSMAKLEGEGNISLNSSATTTLTDMSGFSGTISKTGTGNISVGTKSESANWVFEGQAWNGEFKLNELTAAKASVTFKGAQGSGGNSYMTHSVNYAQNICLEKNGSTTYGLLISNGSSNKTTTFSGAITGNGDFFVDRSSYGTTTTDSFQFSGDLSAYTGNLHYKGNSGCVQILLTDNGGSTSYADNDKVAGTGKLISDLTNAGNKNSFVLNYDADHGMANAFSGKGTVEKQGEGTLRMSGDISGLTGKLLLNGGGMVMAQAGETSLNAEISGAGDLAVETALKVGATGSIAHSGELNIRGEGSISGTNYHISVRQDGSSAAKPAMLSLAAETDSSTDLAAIMSDISVTAEGIYTVNDGSGDSTGSFSNASVDYDKGDNTLSDIALSNSTISNSGSGTLTLNNVSVDANSRINNTGEGSVQLNNATLDSGTAAVQTNAQGIKQLIFDNFSGVTLGQSLTLALSAETMQSILSSYDKGQLDSLQFIFKDTSYTEGMVFNLQGSGAGFEADRISFVTQASNGDTLLSMNFGYNAPEPTSSTLSLMALAALAARRRRL